MSSALAARNQQPFTDPSTFVRRHALTAFLTLHFRLRLYCTFVLAAASVEDCTCTTSNSIRSLQAPIHCANSSRLSVRIN